MLMNTQHQRRCSEEVNGETHLYRFKPPRLLYLVVDDRLVLINAFVSSPRENHVLHTRKENTSNNQMW